MESPRQKPNPKLIVVGAGAAGLLAAGRAAQLGADVTILEKMKRPGRKICISGKGRCNITNVADLPEFIRHFSPSGKFLRQAFHQFFSPELLNLFSDAGLVTVTERGGRVFPASGRAPEVLEVLQNWITTLGVQIETQSRVEGLIMKDQQVTGVKAQERVHSADAVILTTGGASYPATGSSGDGYAMAERVGHTITPVRPALVPLETAGDTAKQLKGLNLRNIQATVVADDRKLREEFGEITFMAFGVSGPVILKMSGDIVDALRDKKTIRLDLDLKPALDFKKLDARLLRDMDRRGGETARDLMRGLVPRPLDRVLLTLVDIPMDKRVSEISSRERGRIKQVMKIFSFEVVGHRPFSEAIITAGGVNVKEIDPRTMASRKVDRLYLAGELLDIQADTGGYNLQAAFSTGWVAGEAAAKRMLSS